MDDWPVVSHEHLCGIRCRRNPNNALPKRLSCASSSSCRRAGSLESAGRRLLAPAPSCTTLKRQISNGVRSATARLLSARSAVRGKKCLSRGQSASAKSLLAAAASSKKTAINRRATARKNKCTRVPGVPSLTPPRLPPVCNKPTGASLRQLHARRFRTRTCGEARMNLRRALSSGHCASSPRRSRRVRPVGAVGQTPAPLCTFGDRETAQAHVIARLVLIRPCSLF